MDRRHKADITPLIFLTKEQRLVFDCFLNAMKSGKYDVIIPTVISNDSIIYYIKLVIAENPELINYDTCNCSYIIHGNKCYVKMNRAFRSSKMEYDLIRKANEILKPVLNSKVSDIKKVLYIHDYLVKHVTYKKTKLFDDHLLHLAYGAIVNNEAVCEGIAYAFSFLLKLTGIKSTVVDGYADNDSHAWNIVQIGTECYHFDVTWDLIRQNDNHNMIYDYFCLSDSDFENRIWDKKIYPICNSRLYNYFVLSKSFAHNENDLITIIEKQFAKYRAIYLKYDYIPYGKEKTLEYIWNIFLSVVQKNGWHYKSVTYSLNEDQNVFLLSEK